MTAAVAPVPVTPTSQPPSRPAVLLLRSEIGALLRRADDVARTQGAPIDFDLAPRTLALLRQLVVRRRGELSDVAASLGMNRVELGTRLDELEQFGLLSRRPDARQPTVRRLSLTDMGRRVGQGADATTRMLEARLETWTDDEIETVTRLLRRLNGA